MLLPIHQTTSFSKVLQRLNNNLLYFFEHSITRRTFSASLFLDGKNSPCYKSKATRKKFNAVFNKFKLLSPEEKQTFCSSLSQAQSLINYFNDTAFTLPVIHNNLLNSIKELTTYLYSKTKDLDTIISFVDESIDQHYRTYLEKNKLVCKICGFEYLSQDRSGITDNDQDRADYDHLLASSKYPLFAVHPKNFLPTCHTCNTKAKKAKDLLYDVNNQRRRLAFYPYEACCQDYLKVTITEARPESIFEFIVGYDSNDPLIIQKIETWKEVYEVPQRIEGTFFSTYYSWVSEDCRTTSFSDFRVQITRRIIPSESISDIPNAFWKLKFYQCLNLMEESELDCIFEAIKTKFPNEQNMEAIYFSN